MHGGLSGSSDALGGRGATENRSSTWGPRGVSPLKLQTGDALEGGEREGPAAFQLGTRCAPGPPPTPRSRPPSRLPTWARPSARPFSLRRACEPDRASPRFPESVPKASLTPALGPAHPAAPPSSGTVPSKRAKRLLCFTPCPRPAPGAWARAPGGRVDCLGQRRPLARREQERRLAGRVGRRDGGRDRWRTYDSSQGTYTGCPQRVYAHFNS